MSNKDLSAETAKKLKALHVTIDKNETKAKEARRERDQIITDEIKGNSVSVSVVANAAGVTRQHIYKNILGEQQPKD